VSAGFPSPAADYEDKRLDINDYLVRNPVSTFFFTVSFFFFNRSASVFFIS